MVKPYAPKPHASQIPKLVLLLLSGTMIAGCGPGESTPEPDCVAVDEQLGNPGAREWCDGQYSPENLEFEGELAVKMLPVCLPPLPNGECELCPTSKVLEGVEKQLHDDLTEYRPSCDLDHWELGCMRTVENAILLGREPDYCCFQVALWGEGCADATTG